MRSSKTSGKPPREGTPKNVRAHPSTTLLAGRMARGEKRTIRPSIHGPYVMAEDGAILPPSSYDPSLGHILVEG